MNRHVASLIRFGVKQAQKDIRVIDILQKPELAPWSEELSERFNELTIPPVNKLSAYAYGRTIDNELERIRTKASLLDTSISREHRQLKMQETREELQLFSKANHRPIERIPKILALIEEEWYDKPDLRFFQLLTILKSRIGYASEDALFNYEDRHFIEDLRQLKDKDEDDTASNQGGSVRSGTQV